MSKKKRARSQKYSSSFTISKNSSDKFVTYERMWAKNGVVYIEGKDGRVDTMTTLEAANRAARLNDMLGSPNVPEDQRKRYVRFVEKVIEVIKDARNQLSNPENVSAKIVSNVLQGKTAEGKPVEITERDRMARLEFKYPELTSEEIKTVSNERSLSLEEKTNMLRTVNQDRMCDKLREADTASQKVSGVARVPDQVVGRE